MTTNYLGPPKAFPHVSITDILKGKVAEGAFKDRIALGALIGIALPRLSALKGLLFATGLVCLHIFLVRWLFLHAGVWLQYRLSPIGSCDDLYGSDRV